MMNNEFEKFFFNKMFFGINKNIKIFNYLKKKTFKIMIFSKL